MSTSGTGLADRIRTVKPFELFFDLVFVFGFTQVTAAMADDVSIGGFARGALVIAAFWWAWVAYAWLASAADLEEDAARLVMVGVMAAMMIAALAVPEAFGEDAWVFGIAYFVVRALHVALYALVARRDAGPLGAIIRFAPTALLAPAAILLSAAVEEEWRPWIWLLALLVDYLGALRGGGEGWVFTPSHFTERHGLIVIVALGESLVATGIGAEDLAIRGGVIVAALLSVAVIVSLWWTYFDQLALIGEANLEAGEGATRVRMARDAYSYLHLPIIAGIIFFALGAKKTLAHVDEPLKLLEAVALSGGLALYLTAEVLFMLRVNGYLSIPRIVAAITLVGVILLHSEVDAVVLLAVAGAIYAAVVIWETVRFAEFRREVRGEGPTPTRLPRA